MYRKDEPTKALHVTPDASGFQRYYYSQPTPEGGIDNNRLEDLFSTMESNWPAIVQRMARREDVNDVLESIFEFIALQLVRVPASRDASEARFAATVKASLNKLHEAGRLPPAPVVLGPDFIDNIVVSIDPHKSIHEMVNALQVVGQVLDRIGVYVVHNSTGLSLLTSDNPVVWFDPSVPDVIQRPYELRQEGPAMLLFPISPTMLLMGDSSTRGAFVADGLIYGEAKDQAWVAHVNAQVCRFGYEAIFAREPGHEEIIIEHAGSSPVNESIEGVVDGKPVVINKMVFGRRGKKPKWTPREDHTSKLALETATETALTQPLSVK